MVGLKMIRVVETPGRLLRFILTRLLEGEDTVHSMVERGLSGKANPSNYHKEFYNFFVNFRYERDSSFTRVSFHIKQFKAVG